jgi:hypothetical protein
MLGVGVTLRVCVAAGVPLGVRVGVCVDTSGVSKLIKPTTPFETTEISLDH